MRHTILFVILAIFSLSCRPSGPVRPLDDPPPTAPLSAFTESAAVTGTDTPPPPADPKTAAGKPDEPDPLLTAENSATPHGRAVLKTGRIMTVIDGEIIPGGCWHYANEVYNRAGYPPEKRDIVFKGDKDDGPYADPDLIRPGDWLYYINHWYGKTEHSAIFVDWVDYDDRIGLMLSYGGESRREPARYRPYDLTDVYHIVRPEADGIQ